MDPDIILNGEVRNMYLHEVETVVAELRRLLAEAESCLQPPEPPTAVVRIHGHVYADWLDGEVLDITFSPRDVASPGDHGQVYEQHGVDLTDEVRNVDSPFWEAMRRYLDGYGGHINWRE